MKYFQTNNIIAIIIIINTMCIALLHIIITIVIGSVIINIMFHYFKMKYAELVSELDVYQKSIYYKFIGDALFNSSSIPPSCDICCSLPEASP